jgi:hypothetical protein
MHDVKHVTPLWYVFTMNATTNTPHPSCPDAVIMKGEVKAEVEAEVVAVARRIPLSLTSVAPPTLLPSLSIDNGPPPLNLLLYPPCCHHPSPHRHHCPYPFTAVLHQSS